MATAESSIHNVAISHDEVQEDLANNNDPNNNAIDVNTDEEPQMAQVSDDPTPTVNISDDISSIIDILPESPKDDGMVRLEKNWSNPLRQGIYYFQNSFLGYYLIYIIFTRSLKTIWWKTCQQI